MRLVRDDFVLFIFSKDGHVGDSYIVPKEQVHASDLLALEKLSKERGIHLQTFAKVACGMLALRAHVAASTWHDVEPENTPT